VSRSVLAAFGLAAALLLSACGGGGGAGGDTAAPVTATAPGGAASAATAPGGAASAATADPPPSAASAPSPATATPGATALAAERPASRDEAMRFLAMASFGANEAQIARLMALGYAAWVDEQLAMPAEGAIRRHVMAADALLRAGGSTRGAVAEDVLDAFWKQAVEGPDQLRRRVAYALSQIFVISLVDSTIDGQPVAAAAWLDMLADEGLGSYRQLIERVSLSPLMGVWLSHLRNQKADPATGRVPDENYAREVMQLFSIGLVALNEDGTPRLVDGRPVETYGSDDVAGLAKVFTGFSWACPAWPDTACFRNGKSGEQQDPERWARPMLGYPAFHATEEKRFLGAVVPAQAVADPATSLRIALDTIAAHPNVGPFIGRQLIQRLVTSNPTPAHVAAVARAFADNGRGVRGDMRAVVRAVLQHPDARRASEADGKLREPVLRAAAFLRAFPHRSDSTRFRVGNTDNVAASLGQSPLRAPSVFNFYRPGYVAPGTRSGGAGLAAPELQIAHETSAAGYVNWLRDAVAQGVGVHQERVGDTVTNRRDVQRDDTALRALADTPPALVDEVMRRLVFATPGRSLEGLRREVLAAVESVVVPAPNADASNQRAIDDARRLRVHAALLLVAVSPEFTVQR
jgi:uncharacterized protein (DUF1800 family)